MERKNTFNLGYFLVAFLILIGFQLWFTSRDVARISYSEMINYIEKGQVRSVAIADNTIEGKFKYSVDGKDYFVTYRVPQELAVDFDKYKVDVTGIPDHSFLTQILSWVLPIVIFFAIWAWFFRKFAEKQGLGGMMNIGKSKAKIYVERDTGMTFDDVAGADEAKVELKEVVSFLTEREKYGRLGAHIPKGLLLVGPPGTGKTLIAKAVAGFAREVDLAIRKLIDEAYERAKQVLNQRRKDLDDGARMRNHHAGEFPAAGPAEAGAGADSGLIPASVFSDALKYDTSGAGQPFLLQLCINRKHNLCMCNFMFTRDIATCRNAVSCIPKLIATGGYKCHTLKS